jgi:hypothetical protein
MEKGQIQTQIIRLQKEEPLINDFTLLKKIKPALMDWFYC